MAILPTQLRPARTTEPAAETVRELASARTVEASPNPAKIRLENIGVTFPGRRGEVVALENVSLSIQPGEFACLVGPSGCGKSTRLNISAGLIRPQAGVVYRDETPITSSGPDRAVIFQESALFPWLSAVQNVEFALKHIRNRRERRDRAMEFLQMVHLTRFAGANPHELSGGMRQRVAIARALAMDPDILLMDEPFAALDAQTRDMLIEEVQRIWLETRKTVVFVTHNVLEAVTLGDRVFSMGTRPGRIKQEIVIQLSRPRQVESPETARVAQRILADLKDEISKIVQEESDLIAQAEQDRDRGRPGHPGPLSHSGPGVMGDGI
jgi:NitT/TauT family transport system ATP-binding protein